MARPVIGITMVGVKAVEKALAKLPAVSQKKVLRGAIRKSVKRVRKAVSETTPVDTGNLQQAIHKAKIRAGKRSRTEISVGWLMPTREELGVPPPPAGYYPAVVEYGSVKRGIVPRPFIRRTTDTRKTSEYIQMGDDVGMGIKKEWARLAKKK